MMKIFIAGLFFLLCLSCAAARPRNGTLIVTVSPAEGGTTGGSGTYPGKTKVTIRAVPFTGWSFVRWQDGSTNAERVVTVPNGGTARYVASLVFVPSGNVALSAEPVNGGTVSGAGSYPVGKAVDIRAIPFANWSFVRWQDNLTNNPRTITVPSGSILFTATFATNVPPVPVFTNGTVWLVWDAVPKAVQYITSWGVSPGNYTNSAMSDMANVRIGALGTNHYYLLTNQIYYFAVQGMGSNGTYGPFSCEVWGRVGDTNSCSP